jgi:hypothetical protein
VIITGGGIVGPTGTVKEQALERAAHLSENGWNSAPAEPTGVTDSRATKARAAI